MELGVPGFMLVLWFGEVIVVCTVSVFLLSAVLGSATLRSQPFRWLQALTAVAAIAEFLLLCVLFTPYYFNDDGLLSVPAVCYIGIPLVPGLYWVLIFATLATSADRLCSLTKRDVNDGFTQTQAIVIAVGSILVPLILSVSLMYGLDLIYWFEPPTGGHVCAFHYATYSPVTIVKLCLAALLILSAVHLGTLLYKAAREFSYPVGNVLPVIIGNILLAIGLLLYVHGRYLDIHAIYLDGLCLSLMFLVWLLGDRSVRSSLVNVCCPCCPLDTDEEKDSLLN